MRRLPTIKRCEQVLALPASGWKGKCYLIASMLVDHKLVDGVAVYGHWVGPVKPGTMFYRKSGMGFVQHGWVLRADKTVVDPTRWVFEGRDPYLYAGPADHYDEGGNRLREARVSLPPAYDPEVRVIKVGTAVSADTCRFLMAALNVDPTKQPTRAFTVWQLAWVMNLPPSMLGDHLKGVYRAAERLKLTAHIPIDNYRAFKRGTL